MADLDNFERLVSGLTLEERQSLLEKLKGQFMLTGEVLYFQEAVTAAPKSAFEEYNNLPWYLRFWYSILGFFKSRTPSDIFSDKQVSALGRKLDESNPGVYDYQNRQLLSGFYANIVKLKDAARYFYSALDISVNRDRSAFFAFLASLEMPDIHRYLSRETSPIAITERNPGIDDASLRQASLEVVENAFSMINEQHRSLMYFNVRSLFCLKQLSSFLFDRVTGSFSLRSGEESAVCSVNSVRELLVSLNDILFSLKTVPPLTLLESLFVFAMQDRGGNLDIGREIGAHLMKAESAISVIRDFNRHIPLTRIIRCYSKDMTLSPREISGGEDWLLIFRDYWKKRSETLCSEYIRNRQQRELIGSFRTFLNGNELKFIDNIQSEQNPDGFPSEEGFTLSFLLSFFQDIFMPVMNKPLHTVLYEGKFQRREQFDEFADSYDHLAKLESLIKNYEIEISMEGDYGRRYAQARQDMSSITAKRRKIQIVLDEASEDAKKIISDTVKAVESLVNIILTMPEKETIAEDIVIQLQRMLNLMDDISAMEK